MTFEEWFEFRRLRHQIRALQDENRRLKQQHAAGAEQRMARVEAHHARNQFLMMQVRKTMSELGL